MSGRTYVQTALRASGGLPQPCFFCSEPVTELGRGLGVVHHVDHDRSNNDPSNLAFAHHTCHADHHMRESGMWTRSERNAKISESNRRRWADTEEAERMIAPRRGRPNPAVSEANHRTWQDPDTRRRRSDGIKAAATRPEVRAKRSERHLCERCGRTFTSTWLSRHQCVPPL